MFRTLAAPLSPTQQAVLQELAGGNQLSMQRQSLHGDLFARWDRAPEVAPVTVRRSTLRVLIGLGYLRTVYDAGLFLPGQTFSLTRAGKRAARRET